MLSAAPRPFHRVSVPQPGPLPAFPCPQLSPAPPKKSSQNTPHSCPVISSLISDFLALAGVAQWIEHLTVKQRVASSIPSQGTCLGCRLGPQQGALKRQLHIAISLPPCPSLKVNK